MSSEQDRRIEHLELVHKELQEQLSGARLELKQYREKAITTELELREQLLKSHQETTKLLETFNVLEKESVETEYESFAFDLEDLGSLLSYSRRADHGSVQTTNSEMSEINQCIGSSKDHKFKELEERLQAIENKKSGHILDAKELILVPNLKMPLKFRIPNFDKYDGSNCPKEHITTYCRMMTGWENDDKLLIHCFQYSLRGFAREWYNQLSQSEVQTWRQLAQAFIAQYEILLDLAPDRLTLRGIKKGNDESFRRYAQRWVDVASQIRPPLTEKEKSTLFLDTLENPYYKELIHQSHSFINMVKGGEQLEMSMKRGKWGIKSTPIVENASDDDTSSLDYSVHVEDYSVYSAESPQSRANEFITQPEGQQSGHCKKSKRNRREDQIAPIPMLYAELLPLLLEYEVVEIQKPRHLQPPYPKWYDESETCEYHSYGPGHSIENCIHLKYKVRDLIKAGVLMFVGNGALIHTVD